MKKVDLKIDNMKSIQTIQIVFIFVVSIVVRGLLIYNNPIMFHNDAYTRLANLDNIFVAHWLPSFQILLIFINNISDNPFFLKIVMSFLSTGAVLAVYFFASNLFDRSTAFLAALLCSFGSSFLMFSTVPYQESLFFLFMFSGLGFLERYLRLGIKQNKLFSAILIGMACLTRYEGFLMLPLVMVRVLIEEHGFSVRSCLYNVIYFFWPVLFFGLFILTQDFSPSLPSGIESSSLPVSGFINSLFLRVLPKYMGMVVYIGSLIGILFVLKNKENGKHFFYIMFIILNVALLLFRSTNTGTMKFTPRMPLTIMFFMTIYSAYFVNWLLRLKVNRKIRPMIIIAVVLAIGHTSYYGYKKAEKLIGAPTRHFTNYVKQPSDWIVNNLELSEETHILMPRLLGHNHFMYFTGLPKDCFYGYNDLFENRTMTIVNREVESEIDYIIVRKRDEKKILDGFGRDNLSLVKQLSHVNIYVKTQ